MNLFFHVFRQAVFLVVALAVFGISSARGQAQSPAVVFSHVCSPEDSYTAPIEAPFRSSVCLNGRWKFEPVPLPSSYKPDAGDPPILPPPSGQWSPVKIKIPSPFNVNSWGNGRDVGAGTANPYSAGSVYYPSYPAEWDHAQMGWVDRSFRVPAVWAGKRILLHFGAVAGSCQVLVNGHSVADHFDSFLPFDIDITGAVNLHGDNDLLVGIRGANLFNSRNAKYANYIRPYPNGSSLDSIVGIWQDVYLLGLPPLHISDTYIEPNVSSGHLEVTTTLRNDSAKTELVTLSIAVCPWVNLAGHDVISAPEPKWKLGASVVTLNETQIKVPGYTTSSIILETNVGGHLKLWSPASPNLYGAVVKVSSDGVLRDTKYTRFGWRQLTIRGRNLLLNGKKIQLVGDICHPFSPAMMSRRYAWAWFSMIKDFGGNAVRLHAQPWPPFFLDMADDMGIMVLDEDALFGSSISLDLDSPDAWARYNQHLTDLVRRDRNHPSVFGWSFGNEMFAVLKQASPEDANTYQAELVSLGKQALDIDPTRPWISCDGDQDLSGALPTWSRHLGLGLHLDQLPDRTVNKPLMVGESGGTYYARPSEMAQFNGDGAYSSYAGRNDALGIDVYQNVVKMARPMLTYFSASETVWFGLEHLNYGYQSYSRLPNLSDGVFFSAYIEGQPGMQLERIPPYVATLNPGWDPALPVYKPLGMFKAFKAAMHQPVPLSCRWDHFVVNPAAAAAPMPTLNTVSFAGSRDGELFGRLSALGVPFAAGESKILIIDGESPAQDGLSSVQAQMKRVTDQGGIALIMVRGSSSPMNLINSLLPAPASLTNRVSTQLDCPTDSPITSSLTMNDRYFAEDSIDTYVQKCGIDGAFARQGTVLLAGSNTDWSFFVNSGEVSKCGAEVLYEHLTKPSGDALVSMPSGNGTVILCSLDYLPLSQNYVSFWRKLLSNVGIVMGKVHQPWILPAGGYVTPAPIWQYTTLKPAGNWFEASFDDSAWSSGPSGFGTSDPGVEPNTPWRTDDIWLRSKFQCTADSLKNINVILYHDEDVDVFVNGTAIFHEAGFISRYETIKLPPSVLAAFHIGSNIVAVHCHQTAGGQFIDLGFSAGSVVQSGSKPVGHDLLLNGPQQ
jgi:beta-galactosidase